MTREEIAAIFTDLGLEAPSKGVVNSLLNAFNKEKSSEIETAKKTATDEAEAKYKGFVKPEDHQKIVDELQAEKGKGALAERKAKYQKANLNIDDEDLFSLIDAKLKDSKDFDKDLEDYVKNHPSFLKSKAEEKVVQPKVEEKQKVKMGGVNDGNNTNNSFVSDLSGAISEHYNK